MKKWFVDSQLIECSFEKLLEKTKEMDVLFTETTKKMPGLTEVELLDSGRDFVTIRTNEGVMKRTGMTASTKDDRVIIGFDEEYKTSKGMTISSHYEMVFLQDHDKVKHELAISEIQADGALGFFYKKLGKSSIGKAVLHAFKTYLEEDQVA